MKASVLDWIDSMRDFDWCSGFQDDLDDLEEIVRGHEDLDFVRRTGERVGRKG